MQRKTTSRVLTLISLMMIFFGLWWAQNNLDPYIRRILNLIAINAIWAVTFNLIYGYTGQFSLGHAGFAAVGAYVVALLTLSPVQKAQNFFMIPMLSPLDKIGLPFLPALILAGIIAGIVGFLVGLPALQFRGDYMAVVTLGLAEIIRVINMNLQAITNGTLGLKGIPGNTTLLWSWGMAALTVAFVKTLVNSSYGRAFKAIRDDELAAAAMGIKVAGHKMLSFVISAFFTGIGGGLFAALISTIDPNLFTFLLSYQVVTVVVLGGVGSITGSFIGSAVYVSLFELLRPIDQPLPLGPITIPGMPGMRMVILSIIFLVVIVFYRRGIMGTSEFSWEWLLVKLGLWREQTAKLPIGTGKGK
jgi:branched-chain amino acid transport system permease protein